MTRARDVSNLLGTSGTNGQVLTIDTNQNNGYAFENPAQYVSGKNFLINGNYDIWQKGTSISSFAQTSVDRWYTQDAGGATVSQQTTGAPAGSRYFCRVASTAAAGGANLYQFIETNNVAPMWGKTVTLSVKLRRNASMTANLAIVLYKSSTVDANINQHPANSIANVTITPSQLPTGTTSSDWYTATITAVVPNDGTANSVYAQISISANIPSGAYYEVAQAQLEIGSVATPFSRAGGTFQGELALCQRYFEKSYDQGTAIGALTAYGRVAGTGNAAAGTAGYLTAHFRYKVSKRVSPTFTAYDMVGASGKVTRTVIATADYNGNGYLVEGQGADGITILSSSGTAANLISFHFTADAEL